MEFKKTDAGNSGHIYRLQKIYEIQKILTTKSTDEVNLEENTTNELLLLTQ